MATNYYVAKTGNNANAGTTTAGAWLTINRAVTAGSVVAAGDIVNVLAGTYTETVVVSRSGNATSYITITAVTPFMSSTYIIAGSTLHSSAFLVAGDYVKVIGFNITGGGAVGLDLQGSFDEARRNFIHDIPAPGNDGFGGAGIDFSNFPSTTDGIADGNIVANIGAYDAAGFNNSIQGLYASIPRITFSNNIVYGVLAYAVNTGHYATSCTIVNNTLFGNGNVDLDSGGVVITGTDAAPTSNGHHVRNNIIYDNQGIGIHEEGTQGSGNLYSNNLVFGNNTNYGVLNGHSNLNNITNSPTFVTYIRAGGGNYHLSATSLCISAGTSSDAPAIDFDQVARPQNVNFDIGAYEFVTAGGGGGGGDGVAGSPKNWRRHHARGYR